MPKLSSSDIVEISVIELSALFYLVQNSESYKISFENLREALSASKFVYASGDTTGATDYTNIQAAIVEQTFDNSSRAQGLVILVGEDFYINAGLVIGDASDNTVKSCNLTSVGQSRINYVGSLTSDYLISIYGETYSQTPRLANLFLECNYNTRGVLMHRQVYGASVLGVIIKEAIEVGLDWATSYKAAARDVTLNYTKGIALRVWNSQATEFTNLRISNTTASDYPSTTDETVYDDYESQWIQTATSEQAAVVIRSQDIVFRNTLFENNNFTGTGKPIVHINGAYSASISFNDSMHFEDNVLDAPYVIIDGAAVNTNVYGRHFKFENFTKHDSDVVPALVKTTGYIDGLRIDGVGCSVSAGSNLTNLIVCDGASSHLYRTELNNVRVNVTKDNQIVATNGGTIEITEPIGVNFATLNVPRAGLTYDSTYNITKLGGKQRWSYLQRDFLKELEPEDWWTARSGIRLGDAAVVSGTWKSIGSNGTAIQAYSSPVFYSSVAALNNMPGVLLSGSNYFATASALFNSVSGAVICVFKRSSTTSYKSLFSQNDAASNNKYVQMGSNATNTYPYFSQIYADTADTVVASTTNVGTDLACFVFYSNDTSIKMWVNGTEQARSATSGSNNGDWFYATQDCDNSVIGGNIRLAGFVNGFVGYVCEVVIVDHYVNEAPLLLAADQLMALYGL